MKGVSIAMETIVYLILAVLVMTVLLYFFISQANPVQDRVKLEQDRAVKCGQYVQYDFGCKNVDSVTPSLVNSLLETCKKLNERGCDSANTNDKKQECIQYCCNVCPTRP